MLHLEPTKTRLKPMPIKNNSQQEIQDRINASELLPSEDVIRNILIICEKLNDRITRMENRQKRMADIASALANGIQPD